LPEPDIVGEALHAPAVARNKDVILEVLRQVLPPSGLVLEIAAGTGEHAVHFAAALPGLRWLPSDPDPVALDSIRAHIRASGLTNVLPPVWLDASATSWPVEQADAVVAINMVHIAPWSATDGLMAGVARLLPADGLLYLYGPFNEGGRHTSRGNAAFDADLRARNPEWGLRDVEDVARAAAAHGLHLTQRVAMPANNLSLLFV
jgi:SAM-dependent methyltransferase